MSEDRIQRQMEFIIDQQARFSSDIAALDQRLKQQTENLDRIAAITEKHSEHIGNLTDALLSLTRIVEEQGKQIKETNERFKETDERLNTLIDIVERDIADRSEGESED